LKGLTTCIPAPAICAPLRLTSPCGSQVPFKPEAQASLLPEDRAFTFIVDGILVYSCRMVGRCSTQAAKRDTRSQQLAVWGDTGPRLCQHDLMFAPIKCRLTRHPMATSSSMRPL
jgi:hypothetical protein